MDLEFDPGRQSRARRQSRQPHGVLRVPCAARVRQKEKLFRIDKIQNVRERIVFAGQIRAPQRDGNDFRSARDQRISHQFVRRKLSGPDEQPRRELAIRDLQFGRLVRHWLNNNEILVRIEFLGHVVS